MRRQRAKSKVISEVLRVFHFQKISELLLLPPPPFLPSFFCSLSNLTAAVCLFLGYLSFSLLGPSLNGRVFIQSWR